MTRLEYEVLEQYMLSCICDSAHDAEHIYRVLYTALDIAGHEEGVDYDVLIPACLLHDVGRKEQFVDPSLCHATVGAEKAADFLKNRVMPLSALNTLPSASAATVTVRITSQQASKPRSFLTRTSWMWPALWAAPVPCSITEN